jgi:putative hydrolase of the HAD superfamily
MRGFTHIRTWIFDLDNTLYPPSVRLFDQIEVRMTGWVMSALGLDRAEADALRRHYWQRYGTTLAGLMTEHGIDPAPYLNDVHDIRLDALVPDPALQRAIEHLPGRRIVYTNGSAPYALRVLAQREIGHLFDAVYGVENAGFCPKPERRAFEAILALDGASAETAAIFEDDPRNLEAPAALGMTTVLVGPDPVDSPCIHHHANDLAAFLAELGAARAAGAA